MTWNDLPGGDLVREGLEDLRNGRETAPALLVAIGARRLRRLVSFGRAAECAGDRVRVPVGAGRIRQLVEALARAADRELRIYMVGGASAVLMGWRSSTVDVDVVMRPEDDALLRAIPV